MTYDGDEFSKTLAFADVAINQIKALKHPAWPRNYEVWYHYASGYYPVVNQLINNMLAASENISQAELDNIYEKYFSPVRQTERIENASSRFIEQIDLVIAMVGKAAGEANRHNENLTDVNKSLGVAQDRESLRKIVSNLARTAREMESSNRTLEERLTASRQEIGQLQAHLEAVRAESLTDPLTGLSNRKCFDAAFTLAINDAHANSSNLSLLLADIDHFKKFNDTYGHLIGDQVLRLVARALKDNVKGSDMAARFGGEEFAVVLPTTSLRQATTVAEHIRQAVMSKELMKRSTGENLGRITMSIGVASLRRGETASSLIERADSCLYAAKRNGRNRVICEVDPEVSETVQPQVA
jgi:diguanylate cyclase